MEVSIEIDIDAPINDVWNSWVTPEDITNWNYAMDEWCCPSAEINLLVGGKFNYRMEARDGSMGFDFEGEFTKIELYKSIHYKLEDNRTVKIAFIESKSATKIVEIFEVEDVNSAEQQRKGWLGILSNFKQHVEKKSKK